MSIGSRMVSKWCYAALALMAVLSLIGCGKQTSPEATQHTNARAVTNLILAADTNSVVVTPGMQASPLDSTNVMRSFLARGVVRSLGADGQTVVVRHEEIPGFMPKMTMEFNVRDTNELRGLAAGDAITFKVKATEEDSWI